MKKLFLKLCLIAVVLSSCCINDVKAQFYDDEDEIFFYLKIGHNGRMYDDEGIRANNGTYVFNFDGEKATNFSSLVSGYMTRLKAISNLKENINYYEDNVYNVKYDIKYRDDLSDSSWEVYSIYQVGYFGSSWTSYYYFSHDRKTMIYKESNSTGEWIYKLVDKDYYVPNESRNRPNIDNETIYE